MTKAEKLAAAKARLDAATKRLAVVTEKGGTTADPARRIEVLERTVRDLESRTRQTVVTIGAEAKAFTPAAKAESASLGIDGNAAVCLG